MLMFLDNVHDTVGLGAPERADTLDMLNVMRLNTALGTLPRDMFEQVWRATGGNKRREGRGGRLRPLCEGSGRGGLSYDV